MNIVPSSTIHLLKNIPLNPSYEHTIRFTSKTAQINYFGRADFQVASFQNQSYQRYARGRLRIKALADDLYKCNYMTFQNTGHSDSPKWFYAFIQEVNYINENVTEIVYTIDVMQTYMFDYQLGYCFIERETTAGDVVGANIVEEPLPLGEIVFDEYTDIDSATGNSQGRLIDRVLIIQVSDLQKEPGNRVGTLNDGVFQGAELYAFDCESLNDINEIQTFLEQYVDIPDFVLSMYMVPKMIVPNINTATHKLDYGATGHTKSYVLSGINDNHSSSPTTFDGYVPKNNKLYTYPYMYCHVDNGSGDSLNLRYEFFQNKYPVLTAKSCVSAPVQVVLRPSDYRGTKYTELGGHKQIFTETLTLDGYPNASWCNSFYSQWLAQNMIPLALNLFSSAVPSLSLSNGIASSVSQNYTRGVMSDRNTYFTHYGTSENEGTSMGTSGVVNNAANILGGMYQAHRHADELHGAKFCGNVNYANNDMTYHVARARVTQEYARIIDNYFSMFGYAINKLDIPNIFKSHTLKRPHWNYIKTGTCEMSINNCPANIASMIQDIYNNGITFWESGDEVGNYSLDNSPRTN